MQISTKCMAASEDISLGISSGFSQWKRTCIVAAMRKIWPFDLDSIPVWEFNNTSLILHVEVGGGGWD